MSDRPHRLAPTFFLLALCFIAWVILFGNRRVSPTLTAQVTGQTYYVCDCVSDASGTAAPGCVAGNDTNNGTSPQTPWKTITKAHAKFNGIGMTQLQPGETIAFCRGGAFAPAVLGGKNAFCTPENPCVFQDYSAPWGSGNEERPMLRSLTYGIWLVGSSNATTRTRGITVKNLWLKGAAVTAGVDHTGVFTMQGVDDVRLSNLRIENFELGVYSTQSPINLNFPGQRNLIIENSQIVDNLKMGFLGSAENLLIQNNIFDNNGFANSDNGYPVDGQNKAFHYHNIYVSYDPNVSGHPLSGIRILGNTLSRSAKMLNGRYGGQPIVVHGGVIRDIVVEGNVVGEAPGQSSEGYWPITFTPYGYSYGGFENVVIRNNTLPNIGGAGILIKSCTHCVIEGNVITHSDPTYDVSGISVLGPQGVNDMPTSDVDVRYNSIVLTKFNSILQGIRFDLVQGGGSSIVGNAILAVSPYKDWRCIHLGPVPLANFDTIDRNICLGSTLSKWAQAGATSYTLTDWRQFSGFDQLSQALDPLFTSMTDLMPKAGSPLIDAGGTGCPSTDITGKNRPQGTACDVGAYEGGSGGGTSSAPSASAQLCATLTPKRNFVPQQAVLSLLFGTQAVVSPQTVTVDPTTKKACISAALLSALNPNQSYTFVIQPKMFVTKTMTVPNLTATSAYPVTDILTGDFNDDGLIDLSDLLSFVDYIKTQNNQSFSQVASTATFSDLLKAIIDAIRQYKEG